MQGTRKTISMLKIFADHPTKSCFRYDHAPGTSTHLATLTHSTVPTHLPDKTVSQPRTVRYRSLQHTSHTPNTDPIVLIHFPVRSVCFYPRPSELKGKAVPLQAWSGPEGSRNLRLPDLMTTAQDGGKVVSLTHRPPLPPGNTPGTHFY